MAYKKNLKIKWKLLQNYHFDLQFENYLRDFPAGNCLALLHFCVCIQYTCAVVCMFVYVCVPGVTSVSTSP